MIQIAAQIILIFGGAWLAKNHISLTSADLTGAIGGFIAFAGVAWKIIHFRSAVANAASSNDGSVPVTPIQASTKGNGMAPKIPLLFACLVPVLLFTAGCGGLIPKDIAHVINFAEDGTKVKIGQNAVTQMPELAIGRIQADATVIPIIFQTNSATGQISAVVPDVVMSYEFNGRNATFGGMGGTITIATGSNAVQTTLGGQHQPINAGSGSTLPK